MTLVLTGLDIEAKAACAEQQLFDLLGGRDRFDEVDVRLLRFDHPDAPTNEQATAHLRVTVKDADRAKVGRAFSNATMELALGGYAGFHTTTPPVGRERVRRLLAHARPRRRGRARASRCPTGRVAVIAPPPVGPDPRRRSRRTEAAPAPDGPTATGAARRGRRRALRATRAATPTSGCGPRTDDAYAWLRDVPHRRARARAPARGRATCEVRRYELPNLRAVNFVVVGLLGEGVASSTRPDPQAKGLGEYLRSRLVDVPEDLLPTADQE